jgi:exodeoxyribonuclease V alpha subunit
LDTIFRQGKQSEIVTTAHAILQGEQRPTRIYNSLRMLHKQDELSFIQAASPEQSFQAIRYLVKEVIPKQQGFDPIRDLQVMAPMHRGSAGIQALNGELQAVLNPIEKARARQRSTPDYRPSQQIHFKERTQKQLPVELSYGSTVFRIGDKVIQMRNNYDKNIFNGDTGIITSMAADSSTLSIQFGQESIEYAKSELSDLQLAYCISIHKSQGSEYPVVIIPILKQHFLLLQRNLVYTGITRARKKVYLVGCLDAYAMAVKNNKQQVRLTNLCHQIKKLSAHCSR